MLGNSIQLKGWNNTPEIREVLGRSVGFAFSDFEGILHASQMVNFLWKIHEATKVSTCDEPKSVHYFRLLSHQHRGHPTKHWTSLKCNCWSYLNPDIDSWYSWDPTLAPFTPPCSRPTKPWDKSWQLDGGAAFHQKSGGDRKGPIPIASTITFDSSNLWRDELPNFGSNRTPENIQLISLAILPFFSWGLSQTWQLWFMYIYIYILYLYTISYFKRRSDMRLLQKESNQIISIKKKSLANCIPCCLSQV